MIFRCCFNDIYTSDVIFMFLFGTYWSSISIRTIRTLESSDSSTAAQCNSLLYMHIQSYKHTNKRSGYTIHVSKAYIYIYVRPYVDVTVVFIPRLLCTAVRPYRQGCTRQTFLPKDKMPFTRTFLNNGQVTGSTLLMTLRT